MSLHRIPGSRMEIIVADLDSTIADTTPRRHLCPTVDAGRTWEEYAMACSNDKPMRGTVQLLRIFNAAGYGVHVVTNRPECSRKLTMAWFEKHDIPLDALDMRPDGWTMHDQRKVEYVHDIRKAGYEPLLIIEDWPDTAALFETQTGVPVICVNPRYADVSV